jgi:hypothetical protein
MDIFGEADNLAFWLELLLSPSGLPPAVLIDPAVIDQRAPLAARQNRAEYGHR